MTSKLIFLEDDALIKGRDPDYTGIRGWWSEHFPGRVFNDDWKYAAGTEVDHGDSFTRTISCASETYEVTFSFDGYSVRQLTPTFDEIAGPGWSVLVDGPALSMGDLIGRAPWPNIDDLGQLHDSSEDEEVTLP